MSHMVSVSIEDCKNLEAIKERLENTMDSEGDEEEMTPWIHTVSSILIQAAEDGYGLPPTPRTVETDLLEDR